MTTKQPPGQVRLPRLAAPTGRTARSGPRVAFPYAPGFRPDRTPPREHLVRPTDFGMERWPLWLTAGRVRPPQLCRAAFQHGLSWLVRQAVGGQGLRPAVKRLGVDSSYSTVSRRLKGISWMNVEDVELCVEFGLPNDSTEQIARTQRAALHQLEKERLRQRSLGQRVRRAARTFTRLLPPRPPQAAGSKWMASEPNAVGQPFRLLGVHGLGAEPPVLHRRSIEDLQRYALLQPASMQVSDVLRTPANRAARELALEPALAAVLDLHRRATAGRAAEYGLVVSLRIWIANDWEPVRLGTVRPPAQQGGAPDPAKGRPCTASSMGDEELLVEVLPDAQPGEPEVTGVLDDYEIDVQLALSRDWLANVAYGIGPAVDGLFVARARSFDSAGRAREVAVLDLGVDWFGDPVPVLAAARVMWSDDGPHLELLRPAAT